MLQGLHWNRGLGRAGGRKSQLGAGGGGALGLGSFHLSPASETDVPLFPGYPGLSFPGHPLEAGCPVHPQHCFRGRDHATHPPRVSFPVCSSRLGVPPPSHTHSLGSWPRPPSSASVVPFVPRGWVPAARSPGSGRLRGLGPRPARPASRLRPGPPLGARHFLLGREKALPGGGDNSGRGMVALENPEGGSEEAVAAVGSAPGGRRTL